VSVKSFAVFDSRISIAGDLIIGNTVSVSTDSVFLGIDHFEICAGNTAVITADDQLNGHLFGQWTIDTPLTTSDRRFKRDITPLQRALSNTTRILSELRPVSFVLTGDGDNRERFGFIAQELERVLPNIVVTNTANASDAGSSGPKSVLYQDLIAILTAIIQEQQETINALEENVRSLHEVRAAETTSIDAMLSRLVRLEGVLNRTKISGTHEPLFT
jgi:hypothetical protein